MKDKKNTKDKVLVVLIFVILLSLITISMTFAYFLPNVQNDPKVKVDLKTVDEKDLFVSNGQVKLNLNVTNAKMQESNGNNNYSSYILDEGTFTVSLKAGSGVATCTYDLAITSQGDKYIKSSTANNLFEYTLQGSDGNQKFSETNVDSLVNSTIKPSNKDDNVKEGIIGHYSISNDYDKSNHKETIQTWKITSKFYNLDVEQKEQLDKNYKHIIKVVNVNCSNTTDMIIY